MTLADANANEKAFEGFYTDPENHPGGSRKITVDDGTIGVFRQANSNVATRASSSP